MANEKENRGGKRANSGRKKLPKTVTISYRVREEWVKEVRSVITDKIEFLKSKSALFDWEEAKIKMKAGEWVKHRFFLPDEAITLKGEMVIFEDDTAVTLEQFEVFRFNNSYTINEWKTDWSIAKK